MREIKWRQYNKETGKFHYWGYVDDRRVFTSPIFGESEQYTGLKDKNGKEIYEGDIVEYDIFVDSIFSERSSDIIEIDFTKFDAFEDFSGPEHSYSYEGLQIIGNIHKDGEVR